MNKLDKAIERAKSFRFSQNKGDVLNDTEQDMLVLYDRLQYLERIRARGRQMSGGYCADRECKARIQKSEGLVGALKAALLDAREGCIAAYDALLALPDARKRIPTIRATMRKGIEGADALGVNHGKPFFPARRKSNARKS